MRYIRFSVHINYTTMLWKIIDANANYRYRSHYRGHCEWPLTEVKSELFYKNYNSASWAPTYLGTKLTIMNASPCYEIIIPVFRLQSVCVTFVPIHGYHCWDVLMWQ